jgi:type IV secretory pathway TrbF-like protein
MNKQWRADGAPCDPYRDGRQEYDRLIGGPVQQKEKWQKIAASLVVVLGLAVAGLVYLGSLPKRERVYVEIDRIGAAYFRGAPTSVSTMPPERAVRYALSQFVSDIRTISTDPAVITANLNRAFAMVTPAGKNLLSQAFQKNDPWKRGTSERVDVEIKAMLQRVAGTWDIDWQETRHDLNGNEIDKRMWKGSFRIVVPPPKDAAEEVSEKNALGIYVDEQRITRVQS